MAATEVSDSDEVIGKTSEKISDRCRTISVGLLAVVWALWVGDSKASLSLQGMRSGLLVGVAIAAVCALLFDYLQYLFQYIEYKSEHQSPWQKSKQVMLILKQLAVLLAAALFIFVGVNLFTPMAQGQGQTKQTGWVGQVWTGSDESRKERSVLLILQVDPNTGEITARKDGLQCSGRGTEHLVLVCGSVRMDGVIDKKTKPVSYHGSWSLTTALDTAGGFSYLYDGRISAPIY